MVVVVEDDVLMMQGMDDKQVELEQCDNDQQDEMVSLVLLLWEREDEVLDESEQMGILVKVE
mgnify:CR=1 FL=1